MNGAPESFRQFTQWHIDTAAGVPVSATTIAPQKQLPERVSVSVGDASAEVALLDDAEIIATTPARDEDDDAEDAATTRGGRALGRTRSRRANGGTSRDAASAEDMRPPRAEVR